MENLKFTQAIKKALNPKTNKSMAMRVEGNKLCQLEFHVGDSEGNRTIFPMPVSFNDYARGQYPTPLDEDNFFFYESIYSFDESTLSSILKMCKKGDELSFEVIRNCYSGKEEINWVEGHLVINRGSTKLKLNIGIRQ